MKLYRAFSRSPQDDFAVFHDATASLRDCIDFASRLLERQPHSEIWIDEEDWTSLTPVRYYWHRATGSDEGFGCAFQQKHELSISESRVVWPETAVLKSRAEEFISSIEPASDFVVVASPRCDEKYRCEVVVRSKYVLERAQDLRDSTFGGSPEDVLVRCALPIWLDRTQQFAKSPSVMPMPFFQLLDPCK